MERDWILLQLEYRRILDLQQTKNFDHNNALSDFVESQIYSKQKMHYEDYLAFLRAGFFYANIGYIIAPAAMSNRSCFRALLKNRSITCLHRNVMNY